VIAQFVDKKTPRSPPGRKSVSVFAVGTHAIT